MPSPIAFQRHQQVTEGKQGQPQYGPEFYYVLYDDGSIRVFTPENPRRGGTGVWQEVAPPDEYAD